MKRKLPWILLLVVAMLFQPLAVLAEGEGIPADVSAPVSVIDDTSSTAVSPEMSPINPEFYEHNEGALRVSPLELYQEEAISDRTPFRVNLPARYDLREQNRVTAIRDQGPNGSCWAFATYGAMESYLTRRGMYDFSEKHLRNTHGFDWGPNDGGTRDVAAAYLARWSGPIWEKDDPYSPYGFNSPTNLERAMDIDRILYIPDVRNGGDTTTLKQAIMTYGGLYTTINGSQQYDNTRYASHYDPGYGSANHAVTIVGWDDNFSRYNFNRTAPGDGAWIVRNSWGPSYLERGYYYVSYYDAHCGRGNAVFIPREKDTTGRIYQYDPLGATRSIGYSGQGFMANVFRAQSNETLHQVGLFNVASNTSYTVYIVRDVTSSSDFSSNRKAIASGSMELPGYYTINTERIGLKQGEQFAIVVQMSNSSYRYPLGIESPIRGYSSRASANRGESWVSSDGRSWRDLTSESSGSNACVKAITTRSGATPTPDPDPNPTPDPTGPIPVDPDEPEEPDTVHVTSVRLNYTNAWMWAGNVGKITATVLPENATNKKVNWASSDASIASIDQLGRVTGRKAGTVTITAISSDGGYRATCRLTVYARSADEGKPSPGGIEDTVVKTETIDFAGGVAEGYLPIDKIGTVDYTVGPTNATNKSVFVITSNVKVLAVTGNRLIPQSTGTATVTYKAEDGGVQKAFTVHVVEPGATKPGMTPVRVIGDNDNGKPTPPTPVGPEKIELATAQVSIKAPGSYNAKEALRSIPKDAQLQFKSMNTAIADVDEHGEITVQGEGSTEIVISVKGGNAVRLKVTTSVPAELYQITGVSVSGSKVFWKFTVEISAKSATYGAPTMSGKLYIDGSKVTDGYSFTLNRGYGTVKFNSGDIWSNRFDKTLTGKIVIGNYEAPVTIKIN